MIKSNYKNRLIITRTVNGYLVQPPHSCGGEANSDTYTFDSWNGLLEFLVEWDDLKDD